MAFETDTRLDMFTDWVNVFPSPFDTWVSGALSGFEDLLFRLTGDPDVLSELHTAWSNEVGAPQDLADEQRVHRTSVLQNWHSGSRAQFDVMLAQIEEEIPVLGENYGTIAELLKSAGEAAIATANAIVDIIVALLIWALSEAFIALALSVVSFGASVAAWFGSTAAKLGIAAARVTALVVKLEGIIVSILAAIEAAALAVTGLRTAGAIGLIVLKTAPAVSDANDKAGNI